MTRVRPFKGRALDRGLPVEAYRNLRRGGYSVRQRGLVVGHADALMLRDADFVVNAGGHRRYLATGVRNVHAWVRGRLIGSGMGTTPEEADRLPRVRYALARGRFELSLCRPAFKLAGARCVALNGRGCFAAYAW